jgi:hypothetical protein
MGDQTIHEITPDSTKTKGHVATSRSLRAFCPAPNSALVLLVLPDVVAMNPGI